MIRGGVALLLLAAATPGFAAGDPAARIAAAQAELAAAGKRLDAATAAPVRVAGLGQAIAGYQTALRELRAGVAEAGAQAQAVEGELSAHHDEISRLLAALERISRAPQPAQSLHPQGPLGAARASAMLTRLRPALRGQAQALAGQLADLETARRLQTQGQASLAAAQAPLNAAHAALLAAVATAAAGLSDPGSPEVTMMARDSESLTALTAALAASADAPVPPPAAAGAGWLRPVAGTILHHFDEPDAAGVKRPGIVIAAPAMSLVVAPADAVVRYAGPFLEYGFVVVLEPDAETLLVLAGLARLQVQTGGTVHRGDLLGLLGGGAAEADAAEVEEDVIAAEFGDWRGR